MRRRGTTLIETSVVIGLVLTIAAILLPAVGQAYRTARIVAAKSQARQSSLVLPAAASATGHTYNLTNLASGNWNTKNVRQADSYQIGFSTERPSEQAAYFEFDLTPVKGKTVTGANMLIIGSTDYHISTFWPHHAGSPPQVWFKVGIAAMKTSANTVSQIVTGNNIANLYNNQTSFHTGGNPDGGYGWVMDGVHTGKRFDAFHYESTRQAPPRIQNAVNAGGLLVIWAIDRFDSGNDGENYIWGNTAFNTGNQLQIITSN